MKGFIFRKKKRVLRNKFSKSNQNAFSEVLTQNTKLSRENLDVEKISLNTISSVFEEREKYIIIALTGKVGSGCTVVADIFEQPFSEINLVCESPNQSGFENDKQRALRILWRFYNEHSKTFHIIKVRDVITSFLLEDNAWDRIKKYSDDILIEFIKKRDSSEKCSKHKSCEGKTKEEVLYNLKEYNKQVFCTEQKKALFQTTMGQTELYNSQICDFIKCVLPLLSECVRNVLSEDYTQKFQEFGNELRFFGTLDPSKRNQKIYNSTNIYRKQGDSENINSFEPSINTIFTIAERINRIIKHIQRPNNNKVKEPIAVVIDSMKNMYESNYLRDRYSAYYLLAISRDEETRNKSLLSNQRKKLTQDDIDIIDLNERPAVASKKMNGFVKSLISEVPDSYNELKEYLEHIKNNSQSDLYSFCVNTEIRRKVKSQVEELGNNISLLLFDEKGTELQSKYKDKGLTFTLCKYYFSILKDPLRILLYSNELYPFYLQDVETCIQNADILLTNNEEDSGPKHDLKMNLIRYVSLMMHPGLIKPTPIERCMQIAYTAKVNSGCISRQVGAVVTDKDYNILSLGWNDVPCGQTPCAYRNLIDLSRQNDKPAYSLYEWRKDSPFHNLLDKYDFSKAEINKNVLRGLPASFCFKKLNENVTGEKNPMNARSMHGEEKALLQCDQQRVKGGYLFTTSSPCEMCAKNAKEHQISKIYYIEPYPGISQSHICSSGENRAELILFEGAIGRAYTQLYTPILPYKDELTIRGFPQNFKK